MTDLFPSTASLSPRESWLRKNNLIVRDYYPLPNQHGSGRWLCSNTAMTRAVTHDTQDAAEQRYCDLFGLTWWKLESWNEAMSVYVEKNQHAVMEMMESATAAQNSISPNDVAVMIVME